MSRPFRRSLALRLSVRFAVALFALWLPAVTGAGGRATAVAMHGAALSWTAERPHLACHGGESQKKDCCCRGKATLRAANCGCHDGDPAFGSSLADPAVASHAFAVRLPSLRAALAAPASPGVSVFAADAPESPPPERDALFA